MPTSYNSERTLNAVHSENICTPVNNIPQFLVCAFCEDFSQPLLTVMHVLTSTAYKYHVNKNIHENAEQVNAIDKPNQHG